MIKIVIVSLSGGQGKTTLTALLGRALTGKGFRTLIIDLDPLHDLTHWLGLSLQEGQATILDVLSQRIAAENVIYPVPNADHLWIMPAQENLREIGSILKPQSQVIAQSGSGVAAFQQGLASLNGSFDFCVLDAPPQSIDLNQIGLKCADWVIIPAEASFKGCSSLIHTLNLLFSLEIPLDQLLGVIPFRDRWIGSKRSQESRNAIEFMTDEVGETKMLPSFHESEVFKRAINQHTTPTGLGEAGLEQAIQAIFERIVPQPLPKPETAASADVDNPKTLQKSRKSRKSLKSKPSKPVNHDSRPESLPGAAESSS